MTSDEKSCPFCAETIKAAAIKCKHCGSMLPEAQESPAVAAAAAHRIAAANRIGKIAVEKTLITEEQFGSALQVVRNVTDEKSFSTVLFELGFVTATQRDALEREQSSSVASSTTPPPKEDPSPAASMLPATISPGAKPASADDSQVRKPGVIYPTPGRKYFNWGFVVLTFLFPGVGQLILGQGGFGALLLVIGIIMNIVTFTTGYAVLLTLIVSVNSAARYYLDAKNLDRGRPVKPWSGEAK